MKKCRGWILTLSLPGFVGASWIVHSAETQAQANPGWNLLLISVDTLRADHVGAYGDSDAATPNLDRLAREGVLFEQVFTPVPLTLPAHASLFTAMYPPTTGVRDNGERLPPSVLTLAEYLHAQEFDTAAFIGGFVLDRRFGLARGFDEYWGDFPLYRYGGVDPATIQFRGDQVEQAAAEWIAHHHSHPFFVFVHFYDLHGPYLLPEPWRQRFRGGLYDGEVAYVDSLIGQLWEEMLSQGLAAHTLLAVTSDHGEALGEHGEQNHGFLLYRSTTRVPWIIRFPDGRYAGEKIQGLARLIDVAPTLCSLLGLPVPRSFQGRTLAPEIAGQRRPPLPAYSETLYPYRHFHTAPLRVLRTEQFTFIQAPRSELYDMRSDPAESQNLIRTKRAVAKNLQSELDVLARSIEVRSAAPVSPEVMEKLKSLGYLSAASALRTVPWPGSSLPDPKDRVLLYRRFQKALESETEGNTRDVASRLETIAARDPALTAIQIEAGLVRQRIHQDELAVKDFRAALGVDPQNALAHYDLGISLGNLGRDSQAQQEFELAVGLQPWFSRAYTALGLAEERQGRIAEAIASFNRALAIDANDFDALLNRGNAQLMSNEWDKGRQDLERAARFEPDSAEVHQAMGTMCFYRGDLDGAMKEYLRAVELDPRSSSAHSSLGLLYRKLGREAEAVAELRQALTLDPHNKDAQEGLRNALPTSAPPQH